MGISPDGTYEKQLVPIHETLSYQWARRQFSIEGPCSKLQGLFDRKEVCHFQIRSLTPQRLDCPRP